jgi:hypothetical protein
MINQLIEYIFGLKLRLNFNFYELKFISVVLEVKLKVIVVTEKNLRAEIASAPTLVDKPSLGR